MKYWAGPADYLREPLMRQRHRFFVAVFAVFVFLAPGVFANGGTKTPVPHARRPKNDGPYRAKKNNKKSKTMKSLKPYMKSGR